MSATEVAAQPSGRTAGRLQTVIVVSPSWELGSASVFARWWDSLLQRKQTTPSA